MDVEEGKDSQALISAESVAKNGLEEMRRAFQAGWEKIEVSENATVIKMYGRLLGGIEKVHSVQHFLRSLRENSRTLYLLPNGDGRMRTDLGVETKLTLSASVTSIRCSRDEKCLVADDGGYAILIDADRREVRRSKLRAT